MFNQVSANIAAQKQAGLFEEGPEEFALVSQDKKGKDVAPAAADVDSLRAQLREVESKIMQAAPAKYSRGAYGDDIEAASLSKSVPRALKDQRRALRDAIRVAIEALYGPQGPIKAPAAVVAGAAGKALEELFPFGYRSSESAP